MTYRSARKLTSIALVPLIVCACGGSLFHSNLPPPSVYQLSVKAAATSTAIPADLTVLPVRVRTGLDNDQIAALYPDRRLDHFAGARWSGPVDELVQDLALQAFRTRANFKNVHSDASAFSGGYWLEVDVTEFQAEYAGLDGSSAPTIHVHLVARVGASADRHVLGQFDADERQSASDNRLTAVVQAYNDAVNAALGKIVADTADSLAKNLESH